MQSYKWETYDLENISDENMVEKIFSGEKKYFWILYKRYCKKIYNFIFLRIQNHENTEDIVSLIFMKAFEKIHTFQVEKNFKTWLYSIANNTVIDFYRTQKKTESIENKNIFSQIKEEEINIKNKEILSYIEKIIHNFSIDIQEIVFLRIWCNLSYKEIAKITNKSESNCKQIFSRNIKKIIAQIPETFFMLILFYLFF